MIELRLIVASKVHAAAWILNPLWGPDWYPLCTGEHIPDTQLVPVADLDQRVTCKRCIAKIAANPSWIHSRAAV